MKFEDNGRGCCEHDFWVGPSVTHCTVFGSFNPNNEGSGAYRESYEFEVLFGTNVDYGRACSARALDAKCTGQMRWLDTAVTISFVVDGKPVTQVPLDWFSRDWPSRPLMRVHVSRPTRVSLSDSTCRLQVR